MYFLSHVAPVGLGAFPVPLVTGRPCQDFFSLVLCRRPTSFYTEVQAYDVCLKFQYNNSD